MTAQHEILIRFTLAGISDLYQFRFETVEPAIGDALSNANIGFCDYGFCDADYLNMFAYVSSRAKAMPIIKQTLDTIGIKAESIWWSDGGVAKEQAG